MGPTFSRALRVPITIRGKLYNQKICITYIIRIQLYIFTQNSTLGIQLHVSALYIGHRQVVRRDFVPPRVPHAHTV